MRQGKKTLSIILLAMLLISMAVLFTYAYFYSNVVATNEPALTLDDDGSAVILVNNSTDLFMYSKDGIYNSTDVISTASDRVVLKFTADIMLGEDLFITADCHLDLGGYKLLLNGHSVTFMHSYYGSVVLCNGTVEPSTTADRFYFKTPNATVIVDYDSLVFSRGDTVYTNESDYVEIIGVNAKYVSYNALYMVSRALLVETDVVEERLDYDQIESAVTANADGTFDFSGVQFLAEHNYCELHGDESAPFYCCNVIGNIDLPVSYYAYDNVSITYTSSNPQVVSTLGKVTPVADTTTDVVLTANVNVDGVVVATFDFNLHVIDDGDASTLAKVGKSMLLDFMQKYYDSTDSAYNLTVGASLPMEFSGYGVSYAYTVMDNSTPQADITSTALTLDSADSSFYTLTPSPSIGQLNVVSSCGAFSESFSLALGYVSTEELDNEYTRAQNLMTSWYGSPIVISDSQVSGENYNGYTFLELNQDVSALSSYNVTALSYALMNNTGSVYDIAEVTVGSTDVYCLYVMSGKDPQTLVQDVMLSATFSFSTASGNLDVEIQVAVEFQLSDTGSSNFHAFLAYYTYLDRMFTTTIQGYAQQTFSMPFCYGNSAPVFCYDLDGVPTDAINMSLYYNGTDHIITLADGQTSYTEALDSYLATNSLTLATVVAYEDVSWRFVLNSDYIPASNSTIVVGYNYKSGLSATTWTTYTADDSSYTSTFTLAGILRCLFSDGTTDSSGMPDEVLYKWVYDNFNTHEAGSENASYTLSTVNNSEDYLTKFVLIDWLAQNVSLSISSTATMNVTNYKGIEFLTGTTNVSLTDNSAVTIDALQYLAQMPSLTVLDLSGNGLSDRTNGVDNGLLTTISASATISTLDLSDNEIYDFTALSGFANLQNVYVYNNITSGADSIFYGSTGLLNISVYEELTARGALVYTDYSDSPILYTASSSSNDYLDLSGIEYQRRLATGLSIELITNTLSSDVDFYGLSNTYVDGEGTTATVSNKSISWGYVGNDPTTATEFTLTYTCNVTINSTTTALTLTISFDVIRV